ncbi:fungal-specific transcription factor domain-containing protein [Xylogone sp. PMI_703]|nr:fungal-specific transcription factor domain-containing protein [Xylogone sp. PMI_703]
METSTTQSPSIPTSTPPSNDRPRRRRFATTGRARSGCLTCKARKKKCDDQGASSQGPCRACIRLGLVCERLPQRRVVLKQQKLPDGGDVEGADEYGTSREPYSPSLSPSTRLIVTETRSNGFMELFALGKASPERILLKYYIERLAPLCSILQHGGNEFRDILVPMAIDDSSLLYALFTCACTHSIPSIPPTMRLRFESEAARGLAEAIRQNSVSESTIACALIYSTAEVVNGDTKRWLLHLQGAGHLIDQLGGPERLRQSGDGSFLLRNFAYHDIMAALSTGSRPRFQGTYWLPNDGGNSADCLMGIAHEILGHISEICCFIADNKDQDTFLSDSASRIMLQGEGLAQRLHLQTFHFCTTLTADELNSLLHHAEAFRHAALLRLYYFLSRYTASSNISYASQMSECVQDIMAHLYQVPQNLYCELGLIFPLFMAGIGGMNDTSTIDYIRNRLRSIESWTEFQHVARVREILELLWATGCTDWEALLQKLDWRISLA